MKKEFKRFLLPVLILGYIILLMFSRFTDYSPGVIMSDRFLATLIDLFKILPLVVILISLIEVWVKKENVEKHLGRDGGPRGFIWAILLGGLTIGPMIVAFPVAQTLYKKRASLPVIFTYLGAAGVCRIPMTFFEASYLGIPFTVIRWCISLPLIIITSIILGNWLEAGDYRI